MILDAIVAHKKKEVAALKKRGLPGVPKARPKGRLYRALRAAKDVGVIAEIKRRSPSKGLLRKNFDPVALAKDFERSGASALSVLTDRKFFGGSLEVLKKVRKVTKLPILRKDFVIDAIQIREAALAGADAVLLIAAILTADELKSLSREAESLGLDVLYEVHDAKDAAKVVPLKPRLAGVNNRDLRTFTVDLKATEKLGKKFSRGSLLVSESGIFTRADVDRVKKLGARAVLVGESLMRQPDAGGALRGLLRKNP